MYRYRRGQFDAAAQLLGAARQRWEAAIVPVDPAERELQEQTLAALRVALGEPRLDALLRAGRALADDEALEAVRGVL